MEIRVATVNTFFDGVSVKDLNAQKWLMLHGRVFLGDYSRIESLSNGSSGKHPVTQVLEKHNPNILVVNEVLDGANFGRTHEILQDSGFSNLTSDFVDEAVGGVRRGTLVASKSPSSDLKIEIQRFPGGRFCAVYIPEFKLNVIGVQGSPFNRLLRKKQFNTVMSYFESLNGGEDRVIVAGDFNMGADLGKIELPESVGHYTSETFPCPQFLSALHREKSSLSNVMLRLLKIRKGPRCLDHILYSDNLNRESGFSLETSSDHCALIATFKA